MVKGHLVLDYCHLLLIDSIETLIDSIETSYFLRPLHSYGVHNCCRPGPKVKSLQAGFLPSTLTPLLDT